jgi:hypothetical protein
MRIPAIASFAMAGVFLAMSACRSSETAQRADLCGDLGHLGATIAFLASPPANASVGEIRADLDKLDPTFGAVSASGAVPQDVVDRLITEHEAYRATIDGVGDDDAFSTVRAAAAAPAVGLSDAFESVIAALDCPATRPT